MLLLWLVTFTVGCHSQRYEVQCLLHAGCQQYITFNSDKAHMLRFYRNIAITDTARLIPPTSLPNQHAMELLQICMIKDDGEVKGMIKKLMLLFSLATVKYI